MMQWIKENPDRAILISIAVLNLAGGLIGQFSPRAARVLSAAGTDIVALLRALIGKVEK